MAKRPPSGAAGGFVPDPVQRIQGLSTQNNPDRTDQESFWIVPGNWTWGQALNLWLRQAPFPEQLPLGGPLTADYWSNQKFLRAGIKFKRAIAPECQSAFIESVFEQVAEGPGGQITASTGQPFAPRGEALAPQTPLAPAVALKFTIPLGYQMWMMAYSFDLFPSTINELNYRWFLNVNGQDQLNRDTPTQTNGRPVLSNEQVTIGRQKSNMILARPGNVVDVTVTANAAIAAADTVRATIFGYLEPAQ